MKGSNEFMDHLFQAAREEPVGTSIADVNQMLDNAAAGGGVSAGTGSTAWLGKSAIINGGLFVGAIAMGVAAFFMINAEASSEPVRVADITPIEAANNELTQDQIRFPEQKIFVPAFEQKVETPEKEVVTEDAATVTVATPSTDQPVLIQTADNGVPERTTGNYRPEKTQKEPNLNNVYIQGEMPEDPYGLLSDTNGDVDTDDSADPEVRQPAQRIEAHFYLENGKSDASLEKLQDNLAQIGMKIDIKGLERKWRRLRYVDLSFDWESVNQGEKTDCSIKASNFKFIQFIVEHDGDGNISNFKTFVQGRQEYDVTTCGCQMNHR